MNEDEWIKLMVEIRKQMKEEIGPSAIAILQDEIARLKEELRLCKEGK